MKDSLDTEAVAAAPRKRHGKTRRREQRIRRNAKARGFLSGVLAMLKPGDLAIDCGANIGKVSTHLAGTPADIYCYEPDPFAFGALSTAMEGLGNVTLHNAAVGTVAGTVQLQRAAGIEEDAKKNSVRSSILPGGEGMGETSSVEVELIDFPELLEREIAARGDIAFIKMDIEGAELELLEELHARDLIRHIRCMVVETHENKFPELAGRFAALRKTFAEAYPSHKVNLDWI
ncbi:MAG: FkbM family methyltransferase [Sulfitobacter sp.]|nr:FkbM family methyltransferase [Sulfitobacter sp.]